MARVPWGVFELHGSGDSAVGRDSQFFENASIASYLNKTSAVKKVYLLV